MKTLKNWILMLGILASATAMSSCLDDNDEWAEFWEDKVQAIVTVKPINDGSYYLQLDDSTTLLPTNNYLPEVPDEPPREEPSSKSGKGSAGGGLVPRRFSRRASRTVSGSAVG